MKFVPFLMHTFNALGRKSINKPEYKAGLPVKRGPPPPALFRHGTLRQGEQKPNLYQTNLPVLSWKSQQERAVYAMRLKFNGSKKPVETI